MATSLLSVSYLVVYQNWILNDRDRNKGESTIPITEIVRNMRLKKLLKKTEYQIVTCQETDDDKLMKLFNDYMPGRGEEGFKQVVEFLTENKYIELANDLIEGLNRKCSTNSTFPVQNSRILQAQAHLSRLIKKHVDFMPKYWSDVIRVAQTEAAFVQVQVLEHFKSENGNPVGSYREVFDKGENEIHPRIVIQADPGCGKTTYVNKLTLDWANEDEYLREKFDFVFLIPLQTLTMDVFDAIKWSLPDEPEQFFTSYAKSPDSKILLILDAFDELVENSEWYSSVVNILNGQSKQFLFFHLIVTTRRSHVEKIPQQFCGRSLLIKGFKEESMKQFLIKQNVPLPTIGEESNLSHLLQTPLFCVIYCSLHFGGGNPIELEDSYDLIKAMIENSVTNTLQKKAVANVEEQLDEIGKFAFQMLDSDSLYFLKKFCRSSEVIKPSFNLSRVNLDLLIKRRIPTRGVCGFKEEFSVPHQLIAEYLAAKYFARSLTEEQLELADPSALIDRFNFVVLNLPFVRFFVFELLFLYLEKKYDESVLDNFFNVPQLRFFWNCKSNKDILTLDIVSDLSFIKRNSEWVNHSRFIPTLSKCRNLSSLNLSGLSKNQVEQLVNFINNNCFQKLIELSLVWNENVGSTPQLFIALSKCKHLEVLYLRGCRMTVESINELARCIDKDGLADLKELYLFDNENVGSTPQLFTALCKCKHLEVLDLTMCKNLSVESTTELARCIDNNGLGNLKELELGENENVGSTPQLFTALSKCKHLEVLGLPLCKMTVESTTELARCVENNGLANLRRLTLSSNENVGSSTHLFHVLHKCPQLQMLSLSRCSMTQESLNILLSMFNSNTFQQLYVIWLFGNKEIKVDDNFFVAFEKCPKISTVYYSEYMESDLNEVGRKAKETLTQRGCQFEFY